MSKFKKIFCFLLAWVSLGVPGFAVPQSQDTETARTRESQAPDRDAPDRDAPEHWLKKFARLTTKKPTAPKNSLGHPTVLNAFRNVVEAAASSTVKMICRGKVVALGTIVDADGLVATKCSELDGIVVCELQDGTRYQAELVATDRASDIALLKIPADGLTPIRWSDVDPPSVGGWVVTPGLGELPLAIGIVSVVDHEVRGGVLGIVLTEDTDGPRITRIVQRSGAAEAGLRPGDVVTRIDGEVMRDSNAVIAKTSQALPGDVIELTILRNRKR